MDKDILLARRNNGISWFYWITGLSFVNTVAALLDSSYSFIVGLGYTQFIDQLALQHRSDDNLFIMPLLFLVSFIISCFFAFSGYMTSINKKGWYLVAMMLYLGDTFAYFFVQDYIGVGFHVFALYYIYIGYQALRKL